MFENAYRKPADEQATIGPFLGKTRVAYFSMEIALHPEMHTYSGGLGVLAGDTARSAGDLELPMVFVSLVSSQGYLRQTLDDSGWQESAPDPWPLEDFAVPLRAKVSIPVNGREVWVRSWLHVLRSPIGHALPIILLDTDLPENDPADREITHHLYGGDDDYRLRQEIVLGIGGLRLLSALGFARIKTYHLNEGHAALLALDLLRRHPRPPDQVGELDLKYDVSPVREMCIFTTHTPIEAGHDVFSFDLVEELLHNYIELDQLRLLCGQENLNMTRLALTLSGFVNGVAQSHARTTRKMFPGYRIRAITNGVHLPTWAHPAFAKLYNEHYPSWSLEPEALTQADQLPDTLIWAAHSRARKDLMRMVTETTGVKLDPDRPIIGFARRMTSYKRPELLFTDLERLRAINQRYPFQVVLSGKAHHQDEPGKRHIQNIFGHMRELAGEIPIAFLPNYEATVASRLVPGVDVWLNTPVPPMEASGTSGMKAALNGVLNLSVLDGWWIEACLEGVTGWAIGENGGDGAARANAEDLYLKLEQSVLPLYDDDREAWIRMMKQAISKIAPVFNSQRMMRRYAAEAYIR
ncbi:MAG: alpha-glucan family phosphorylase [Wenzhouxiangella sp.]|jgi:starch phosphorylase|nr:alpha-glucan family phosphorylase [Wenzhouxiangella sp.]